MLIKRAALGNLKASFHCTHWHRFFPLKKAFSYLSVSPARKDFFRKPTRPSLPLRKAPPLISLFSPQGRRGKPPSGAQNRYALRLADHQRSTPGCAGWDRLKLSETIAFSNSVLNIVISSKTFLEISIASFIFISPS